MLSTSQVADPLVVLMYLNATLTFLFAKELMSTRFEVSKPNPVNTASIFPVRGVHVVVDGSPV